MAKDNVFKEVIKEYEEKKLYAKHLLKKRQHEIYNKIPEIETIHNKIYQSGFDISKAILKGEGQADILVGNLKIEIEKLQNEEKILLLENNYDVDYLKNVYECEKCCDTGFIEKEKCSCFKQKLINKYYMMSNVEHSTKMENFDCFDLRYYSDEKGKNAISPKDNMKNIYQTAVDFCLNFKKESKNMLLYGDTGLGKTFLCNCIAKEILDRGYTVLYVTAPDVFKTLIDYQFYRDTMDNPDFIVSLLASVDLLIIDDLGTEVATVVTNSELFKIVNNRAISNKNTIISTNLAPSDLESIYSHRLESRLMGNYEMIKFYGNDIRVLKRYGL